VPERPGLPGFFQGPFLKERDWACFDAIRCKKTDYAELLATISFRLTYINSLGAWAVMVIQ
jgi:hypothetical protein